MTRSRRSERGWEAWRNALLASPRFQRWALAFPLTRWIARRRARALFDLCAGFVYSQVLAACVSLRVFDSLAEGPQSAGTLARQFALDEDATSRLLDAAAALDLLSRRRDGRYGLGTLGAALRGNPGIAAMVEHHRHLYADLADPVALLRGEPGSRQLAGYWPYAAYDRPTRLTAAETSDYSALMGLSQQMIAAEVLDAYPLGRHRRLLDVGGGDGAFLLAASARAPELRLTLFDLPAVAERASVRFSDAGLARATAIGGDFRLDPLPAGADIATLIRVAHDHDDETVLAIFRAIREALVPGGTLLLAEPMADTPGAEPVGAYFGFYLLAMGRGRPRSQARLTAMLRSAGFVRIAPLPTHLPMVTRMLKAQVPSALL